MSIHLSITDWRSEDSRRRALDLATAQRAAQQIEPDYDDDAVLDVLSVAIDKFVSEFKVGDDWRIDAQVSFDPDATGCDQINLWFRVYPPVPSPEDVPATGLTDDVSFEPVEETPPGG